MKRKSPSWCSSTTGIISINKHETYGNQIVSVKRQRLCDCAVRWCSSDRVNRSASLYIIQNPQFTNGAVRKWRQAEIFSANGFMTCFVKTSHSKEFCHLTCMICTLLLCSPTTSSFIACLSAVQYYLRKIWCHAKIVATHRKKIWNEKVVSISPKWSQWVLQTGCSLRETSLLRIHHRWCNNAVLTATLCVWFVSCQSIISMA